MIINDRVQRLFDHCQSMSHNEWQSYLDQTCANDSSLKQEVITLLEASGAAEEFFIDFSARVNRVGAQQINSQNPEREQIGPWQIYYHQSANSFYPAYLSYLHHSAS